MLRCEMLHEHHGKTWLRRQRTKEAGERLETAGRCADANNRDMVRGPRRSRQRNWS
jgi:hypothetical protein